MNVIVDMRLKFSTPKSSLRLCIKLMIGCGMRELTNPRLTSRAHYREILARLSTAFVPGGVMMMIGTDIVSPWLTMTILVNSTALAR